MIGEEKPHDQHIESCVSPHNIDYIMVKNINDQGPWFEAHRAPNNNFGATVDTYDLSDSRCTLGVMGI